MPARTAEDAFLRAFGTPVQIRGELVRGILDDDYQLSELGPVRISTNAITLAIAYAAADELGVAIGDVVEIDGTSYTVRELQPDGPGIGPRFTTLRLIEDS